MANTIYASFDDPNYAERAAGALLDHGVQAEHLSLVRDHADTSVAPTYAGNTPSTAYTSGAMIGGPGQVGATGSGIQSGGAQTSANQPASTGFGQAASPGYSDVEVNAAERGQGFIGDADNTIDEAIDSMRESELNRAGSSAIPTGIGLAGAATGGIDSIELMDGAGYDSARIYGTEADIEDAAKAGISVTTPADAGMGAVKGTGVGVGVGVLAAIASMVVPGVGLVTGGGALAIAMAGMIATAGAGAATGAVYGYLKDQGMNEHLARAHSESVAQGGALLAVQHPSGGVEEAEMRHILEKYGATSIGLVSTKHYMA